MFLDNNSPQFCAIRYCQPYKEKTQDDPNSSVLGWVEHCMGFPCDQMLTYFTLVISSYKVTLYFQHVRISTELKMMICHMPFPTHFSIAMTEHSQIWQDKYTVHFQWGVFDFVIMLLCLINDQPTLIAYFILIELKVSITNYRQQLVIYCSTVASCFLRIESGNVRPKPQWGSLVQLTTFS